MMKKGKMETAFDGLLARQDYLVVQANDLAKAFGNLQAFEHKLLDYCFSYVKKDSVATDTFTLDIKDILKHFGLNASGRNYERVLTGFTGLATKTLRLPIIENGVETIILAPVFWRIKIRKTGEVSFLFSEDVAPFVFALRTQYYSFKLAEIARVKSKYGLILMKLWQSRRYRDQRVTTIEGDLNEWQDWFLGSEKRWEPARFRQKVLEVGGVELEEKIGVEIFLNTIKNGRKVVGYEMQIIDNRPVTTAEIYAKEMKEYQMSIDDYL